MKGLSLLPFFGNCSGDAKFFKAAKVDISILILLKVSSTVNGLTASILASCPKNNPLGTSWLIFLEDMFTSIYPLGTGWLIFLEDMFISIYPLGILLLLDRKNISIESR